jgi:hypothetical protein
MHGAPVMHYFGVEEVVAIEPKTVKVEATPKNGDGSSAEVAIDKKFGISVPSDMHAALQQLAEEEGTSVSEVCRRALGEV